MKAGTVAAEPLTEDEYFELDDAWDTFWRSASGSDEELEAIEFLVGLAIHALNQLHERKPLSGG